MEFVTPQPDPDFDYQRFHNAIFVRTEINGGGHLHHVTGSVEVEGGMAYEDTLYPYPPEMSTKFYYSEYLGTISPLNYPTALNNILRSLPTPPRQRRPDFYMNRLERCKADGTPYGPEEHVPPLMKCTEWTQKLAIPTLFQQGLIQ